MHLILSLSISLLLFSKTSGCPWPKATVKSPVGARDLRPLWSFISFIFKIFYSLFGLFIFGIFFLLKLFYCISLSLFHLFPFLFYSFCVFTFFWFMFVSCFSIFMYLCIYLFCFYFLFQKDYSFFNMFYNENSLKKNCIFVWLDAGPPSPCWPPPCWPPLPVPHPRTATGSAIENAAPPFCRWIKMQNCRARRTDAQTHSL